MDDYTKLLNDFFNEIPFGYHAIYFEENLNYFYLLSDNIIDKHCLQVIKN
jgi:hypothetical protein